MKSKAKAITSPSQEKLIGEYLKYFGSNSRMSYYVMYHLIIETGIKFKHASTMRIDDIKDKDSVEISFNCTDGHRTVQLSKQMKDKIKELIADRPSDEWLFIAPDTGSPITVIGFQNALNSIQKKLKMTETLSITTLRKTYFYHCYKYKLEHGTYKDDGVGYISVHTDEWVEEYLGISEPSPNKVKRTRSRNTFSDPSLLEKEVQLTRQTLFEDNYGLNTVNRSIATLKKISKKLSNPYISDEDCAVLLELVNTLENALFSMKEEE